MTKTNEDTILQLPVAFGGISIGDGSARIGIRISRKDLSLERADATLCGKQFMGRVVLKPRADDPSQQHLFEAGKHEVSGAFDVNGFRVTPKDITAGLTFSTGSIDLAEIRHFPKKTGDVFIGEVSEIPKEEAQRKPKADFSLGGLDDDARARAEALGDKWRAAKIDAIGLKDKDAERLSDAGIDTAGDLQDRMASKGIMWCESVPGIGQTGADRIADVFNGFVTAAENKTAETAAAKTLSNYSEGMD